jgi:hypothetical protein
LRPRFAEGKHDEPRTGYKTVTLIHGTERELCIALA